MNAIRPATLGALAVVSSLVAQNVGAAFAKQLFPVVGAYGVAGVRIVFAAILLLALRRPWRRPVARSLLPAVVTYGVALGSMNVLIYQAFARIPLGIAIGIEVTGPLAIALIGSRRPRDLLWLATAATGIVLLVPLRSDAPLDPVGVTCACCAAACWALYIVFGKRVSGALGGDAAAWGMLAATTFALPTALLAAGPALLSPYVLAIGLVVATLSSALPYSLEIEAMRRLPTHVFGLLLSAAPAIGALAGFSVLHETLSIMQWAALVCIIAASAGAAMSMVDSRSS